MKILQKLHENWKMKKIADAKFISATVPGSVYNDLLNAGFMDDPYFRDNELKAQKLMDEDFEYVTYFELAEGMQDCENILLHFDGLDTLCEIYLNGEFIGKPNNMHRIWEYDVKGLLKQNNELNIIFRSPNRFIKEQFKQNPAEGIPEGMVGYPLIRKAHYMFGWDWGARLPDAGIWREVSLIGYDKRIEDVYIRQYHHDGVVDINLELNCNCEYSVKITPPDGNISLHENSPKKIEIENPMLWWPNGYGEQNLYTVEVILENNLDTVTKKIGLRTMTMHIEKDEYGESFSHEVNGIKIFAMGADYIPEDHIISRTNPDRTRNLLLQCVAANFNCIRVWGGGYYPEDWFYDICDELGLIVWQDFMFACAVYNLTEEFEENITAEFVDNIKRIRHHASLGLWCGNNEMEDFVWGGAYNRTPKQLADYIKMYEYIIPKTLKKYDPDTFYWPSSPSSGGNFDEANSFNRGDTHYWEVWHGNKPFSEYRKYYFRYLSEFGFQSFPCVKTIESFTIPEDRNIFSYVMEKHQRNNAANGKIMNYLAQTFLYPTSFDNLVYASQLLQAEAIKYGVEHFRRYRGRCMGAVYWQLNDCWPVTSWASIDYFGRWKALHYYAKRFFAPLMLSCCEEGVMTQDPNVNREFVDCENSIKLCVSNETMSDKTVTVKWALRNNKAEILMHGEDTVTVQRLSSQWLDKHEFNNANLFTDYASFDMYMGSEWISGGTVLFNLPKHFEFLNPNLSYTVNGDEITVKAEAYAKSVQIESDCDMVLSDNYFDMSGGEKTIKILSGTAKNIKLKSVYDIR